MVKLKWLLLIGALISVPSASVMAVNFVDVTTSPHYIQLAKTYLPTLLHETGTSYYPMDWDCDNDGNVENNDTTYTTGCPRVVYIHILKDTKYGYVFIQYWYYYAVNPFINYHKHDWELAMIVFDPAEQPVSLALGAHGELNPNAWSVAKKDPRYPAHPFIYAYARSHAMNIEPANPAPWVFEFWSGGGAYTAWESIRCTFLGGVLHSPARFGAYPPPWKRSIWTEVPFDLDRAKY